ncbi:MAG: tRNA (adenosine(37)-N6)-dimethylallyltransferase MiaA [Candidatus Acidiferrales bacterium]
MNLPRRLVVILGPTASGKSALALDLAQKLDGEVVCCDSTQVYRHFDIGTGKVPPAEQMGIRHHLADLAEPEDVFTAGDYRRHALQTLEEICHRGKLPILTVGTGLYLRALLEGLDDLPGRSEALRERLRQRAASRGPEYLHRILAKCDPVGALQIAKRDAQKLIRAIELCILTGKPASQLRGNRAGLKGFSVAKIGLMPEREKLYAQIDRRVEAMLASGWIEEVQELIRLKIAETAKPFTFLGYAQIREHILRGTPLASAVREIQQATRRYAKRQITWFRREPDVHWLKGFGRDEKIQRQALEVASGF